MSDESEWYDLSAAIDAAANMDHVKSGNWHSCYICGRSFDGVEERHIHRYVSPKEYGKDLCALPRYVISTHKRCHEEVGIMVG